MSQAKMEDKMKRRKKDKQIKEKKEKRSTELLQEYNNDQEKVLKDLEKLEKLHSQQKLISVHLKTKRKELLQLLREKTSDPKWRETCKTFRKNKKANFSHLDEERQEIEEAAAERKKRRIEYEKKRKFLVLVSIPENNENAEKPENDDNEEEEEIAEIPMPTYFVDDIPLPDFSDMEKEYVWTGKDELGFDPKGRLVFKIENLDLIRELLPNFQTNQDQQTSKNEENIKTSASEPQNIKTSEPEPQNIKTSTSKVVEKAPEPAKEEEEDEDDDNFDDVFNDEDEEEEEEEGPGPSLILNSNLRR